MPFTSAKRSSRRAATDTLPPSTIVPLVALTREGNDVAPVLRLVEEKLAAKRRRRLRRGGAVAVLLVLSLVGGWLVPLLRDTQTHQTAPGERRVVKLADGSMAELNALSRIDTDFRFGRRRVHLRHGEGFFTVARDSGQPFLLQTPQGTVRVLGTAFNVLVEPDGTTTVTLAQGAVAFVGPDSVENRLQPKERLVVRTAATEKQVLTSTELGHEILWRTGYLSLDDRTLAQVAARMSVYHSRTIEVQSSVAGVKMGGTCPLDDLAAFFEFVGNASGVAVTPRRDGSYLIHAR